MPEGMRPLVFQWWVAYSKKDILSSAEDEMSQDMIRLCEGLGMKPTNMVLSTGLHSGKIMHGAKRLAHNALPDNKPVWWPLMLTVSRIPRMIRHYNLYLQGPFRQDSQPVVEEQIRTHPGNWLYITKTYVARLRRMQEMYQDSLHQVVEVVQAHCAAVVLAAAMMALVMTRKWRTKARTRTTTTITTLTSSGIKTPWAVTLGRTIPPRLPRGEKWLRCLLPLVISPSPALML